MPLTAITSRKQLQEFLLDVAHDSGLQGFNKDMVILWLPQPQYDVLQQQISDDLMGMGIENEYFKTRSYAPSSPFSGWSLVSFQGIDCMLKKTPSEHDAPKYLTCSRLELLEERFGQLSAYHQATA